MTNEITATQLLQHMDEKQTIAFIREHKKGAKFEQSGYDSCSGGGPGSCTVGNQNLVNMFAPLGIYDYTTFLFLDFYKGGGTIYLQYWGENEVQQIDVSGYGTSAIIYQIFKLTILSGKIRRRRD